MEIILIGAYLLFATFVLFIIAILLDKIEECLNLVKAMTIISILLIFVGALMLPMK